MSINDQHAYDQHHAREKVCAGWLREQAKTVRKPIMWTAVMGIAQGVAVLVQAGLLAQCLAALILNNAALESLLPFLVALLAVFLLRSVLLYAQQVIGFQAGVRVRTAIRVQLTNTFAQLGSSALKDQHSGALAAVMLEQVDALAPYFSRYLPQHYIVGVLPFIMLAVVFTVNWLVGGILLVTAPLIPLFMVLVGMGANAAQRAQFLALSRMSGYFLDRLQGLATLKLFGQAEQELRNIERVADDFREKTMSVLRIAFLSSAVLEFFSALAVALVAVYVGLSLLGQFPVPFAPPISFKVGLFVLLLAPEFFMPLRQLAVFYHDKAAAFGAADAILAILAQAEKPIVGWGEQYEPQQSSALIAFHHVSKTYDQREVLSDINLLIQQGEKIALVGESGAGKTTLLQLLLGLETATSGDIFLCGSVLQRDTALQHIAYIGQVSHIFYGTLADNIALANPNATAEQINAAAQAAGVTEFSGQLPDGLQTLIGERGVGLSGGQVQRVALARAFLKNAPIVLLDEPTAHLNHANKMRLLAVLLAVFKDKTLIIASHDAEVMAGMDRCITLKNGRLV